LRRDLSGHRFARARFLIVGLLLWGTTAVLGCSDPTLKRLNEIKGTVCACATLACADQALTSMPTAPARRIDKAQAIASEIFTCYSRLAKSGDAVPDEAPAPSAPAPAATPTVPLEPTAPPTISPATR
jgi:hypothetical protein